MIAACLEGQGSSAEYPQILRSLAIGNLAMNSINQKPPSSQDEIPLPATPGEWVDAKADFGPGCLKILGHPVMEDWEDPYMADLARIATSRRGRVLEVGFGLGISAGYVQQANVDEHVIIEANADVFDRLCAFARSADRPVRPLSGLWQDVCPSLPGGCFDGILFDTYPLTREEVHRSHFLFFREAHRLLRPGGVLTYYSDESDSLESHMGPLQEAGFQEISWHLCAVQPPPECLYWQSGTFVSPVVVKT
ncbi:class I SAM-dependent methyltransferase [Streptomyces iconiensis]|uniref:Class I SAM-dependent methyltransferase n=1 Tax=Streptomyces iconiensis TaxID=1384038 RepID=A0ABT7A228_9ACTN|nr:class I SAM-dependent methyltransferase [Streptomyces iconiensis]MDJ1135393.1 class I SAM-dependent methyltransferase [Streptomyces iconiensis]